jgi:RNA polymerase sigma factor for flagellar operon FliA
VRRTGDQAARNELVLAHLPLVRFVLGRLPVTPPAGLSREDLLGAGVIALLGAIEDFDPDRGTAFATFAVPRIRGAILDELRAHDPLPRSVRDRAAAVQRAAAELEREGRPYPPLDDVAARVGCSPRKARQALQAVALDAVFSLDAPRGAPEADGRDAETGARPDCRWPTPLAAALARERDRRLAGAVADLPEAERRVIVLYYHHELMIKEIAQVLDVTKSRVSQIHTQALLHLRARLLQKSEPARPQPSAS